MSLKHTNIHFDYGGHYSQNEEKVKWVSRSSTYAISFKTSSLDEITYLALVDKICTKIAIDRATSRLKLSYIAIVNDPQTESYVRDDEDVGIYLTTVDERGLRSVLHVEVIKELETYMRSERLSKAPLESSFGVNYEEGVSNGIASDDDVGNGGVLTIYRADATRQQYMEPIIEEVKETDGEDGAEFASVDNHMDNGLEGMHEFVDLPRPDEQSQYVEEWEDGTGLEIGQEFCSKEALQDLVDRASHKNCYGVHTYKSDRGRLILKCRQSSQGCQWYLRAAKIKKSDYFSVTVYKKMHSCARAVASTSSSRRKGTPRLVASVLHEDYPGQFETPAPKNIINLVQGRVGVSCSYSTALRGKKLAVSDVRGSPEHGYKMLYSYLFMLEKRNPGTVTSVKLDANKKFQYLFIALGASIEGFRAMRKVIVVDATFLKTVYGGQLVFATAQDPDHHHYPIAFGVIDSEKHDSWRWFFKNLKAVIPDDEELVFMSDRHQSIINAVAKVYPLSQHGHCIWHLSQNVRGKVHKVNKDLVAAKFIQCAHIYTVSEFEREYCDLRKRFPAVGVYLDESIELDKWTRCHFKGDKYNLDTSNSCESLNSVFKKARKYSLLPMLDAIIEKIATWFNKHRKESAGMPMTKFVVPFVDSILHERCPIAAKLVVAELNSFHLEYTVIGLDGKAYIVDLKNKTCSCKGLDIDKYPCVHAIAGAIAAMKKGGTTANISVYDLCSRYYLIETWALAYHMTIYPVPNESTWSVPDDIQKLFALPPDYTKSSGRNQENRFPSTGERRRKKSNRDVPGINLADYFNCSQSRSAV